MFEMFKRFQQYPQEDKTMLKGTFFMDWSESADVALFFANCNADELTLRSRPNDGALFICDVSVSSKAFMRKASEAIRVEEIVQRMVKAQETDSAFGCPLLFHPPTQTRMLRANHQEAVYWAQMDFRYDFEHIWGLQEQQQEMDEQIYIKLVLPYAARHDCEKHLSERGITHSYLFPD